MIPGGREARSNRTTRGEGEDVLESHKFNVDRIGFIHSTNVGDGEELVLLNLVLGQSSFFQK